MPSAAARGDRSPVHFRAPEIMASVFLSLLRAAGAVSLPTRASLGEGGTTIGAGPQQKVPAFARHAPAAREYNNVRPMFLSELHP